MADTMQAGVIEGFFGAPWSWAARMSGAEFLRDCGYQFYIYAPKAEAFLRRRWREPILADTQRRLSDLKSRCRELGVHFGIGLTPFEIYLDYDARARLALRSKVTQINEIGPEILCILFDDMRGDVEGLPDLQAKIIGDICAWSSAARFIVCPTYYSYDSRLAHQFGPPPKTYLRDFGHAVDTRRRTLRRRRRISAASPSFGTTTYPTTPRYGPTIFIWIPPMNAGSSPRNSSPASPSIQ
jgi:hypothetical protein